MRTELEALEEVWGRVRNVRYRQQTWGVSSGGSLELNTGGRPPSPHGSVRQISVFQEEKHPWVGQCGGGGML